MGARNWTFWSGALLALIALFAGCGSDDDNPGEPGGGGSTGQYEVYAGFVSQSGADDRDTEEMVFIATVERLNTSDPSAMDAVVTVDGTVIPLNSAISTADDATFESSAITYSPDSTYAVSITIGGKTASASLETPDYETTVSIATPLEGATFTPGSDLTVQWAYTGDAPGTVVIAALNDDEELAEATLVGTTTSYQFLATTTTDWAAYEEVEILIGIGETQSWSGDMAYQGSYSYVLIATASVTITPAGGTSAYNITVVPTNPSVIVGQSTQVTATVTNATTGLPPTEQTTVSFTVSPSGSGEIDPNSVTATAGIAQATFTAGTTPTTATVTATALGYSGQATIEIEPQGSAGQYGLSGIYLVDDTGGDDSFIMTTIHRYNTGDPGANSFEVDVNQTDLTLLFGDANTATYYESITYTPGTTYTWTATGDAGTATATITAPTYSTAVSLTAPANNAEFTVGTPLVVSWEYTGDTPDSVEVAIASDDYAAGGEDHFFYYKLPGSTTSKSFETGTWGAYDSLVVAVTVSKTGTWSGSIVEADSSGAALIISTDLHYLFAEGYGPGPGGDDWSVYLSIDDYYLAQSASTSAAVEIEDDLYNPCPDDTEVTFTVDPAGAATVSPNPAYTTDGTATVTVTAVAASGDVEITAAALGDSDSDYIEIGEPPVYIWAIQNEANPADPPLSALPVGESVRIDLTIEDVITSAPYPDDVRLVVTMGFGGYVTISPTEVTVPGGGGTATITVTGASATTLVPEIITISAPDLGEEIIPLGGFMVTVVS